MAARLNLADGQTPLKSIVGECAHAAPAIDLPRAATLLDSGLPYVQPAFLSGEALAAARAAASAITSEAAASAITAALPQPLRTLFRLLDELRLALAHVTGRPLLDSAEIQLLQYKAGASYRRHLDDSTNVSIGAAGSSVRRSISLLIYLTSDDWQPSDGGALRCYVGDNKAVDVLPQAGSLVLFDSARVAHEVLRTARPRMCIAAWLQERRTM